MAAPPVSWGLPRPPRLAPQARQQKIPGVRTIRSDVKRLPCPVCSMPFRPKIINGGRRIKTCSRRCAATRLKGACYLDGRWSRNHDACIHCGQTSSPHKSRGVCNRCYLTARRVAA